MKKPDRRIWEGCIAHVRENHPDISRGWFEELEVIKLTCGVLFIHSANPVHLRYLQRECTDVFNEAAQVVSGRLISVQFINRDDLAAKNASDATIEVKRQTHQPAPTNTPFNLKGRFVNGQPRGQGSLSHGINGSYSSAANHGDTTWGAMYDDMVINPDYTFENFVQGPNNRLAYAAALAVADNPGTTYNPYFAFGGIGLGKTHLLQAICQSVLMAKPDTRIYYVSCEGFASQLMEAVQAGQMSDFRHRFRDIDILVVDDIHFLGGHEQTQEEFFHTFNTLYQSRKQIVLSSDAAPSEIPDIKERLLSRFNQGIVARLEPPSWETRLYILKTKARLRNIEIPHDVASYFANKIDSNIRELEGALTQVQGLAMIANRPIDMELAHQAVSGSCNSKNTTVSIQDIINTVARHFNVKQSDLFSHRRHQSVAFPRHVAMYLTRKYTGKCFKEIGEFFGGRNHATVMHGINKIERLRTTDDPLDQQIKSLEGELKAL